MIKLTTLLTNPQCVGGAPESYGLLLLLKTKTNQDFCQFDHTTVFKVKFALLL